MAGMTITSSEFNRDSGQAKRAAQSGPVIITDRGAPAHVLLTWDNYQRLAGRTGTSIIETLALPGVENIDFNPPRLDDPPQPAQFD